MSHQYLGKQRPGADALPFVHDGDGDLGGRRIVVVGNETRDADGMLGPAIAGKRDHDERHMVVLVDVVDEAPQHRRIEIVEW